MKAKTTIILIVFLLACAAYVVVRHTDLFSHGTQTTDESAGTPLFANVGEPSQLVIAQGDGPTMRFARADGKWKLVEPVQGMAERYRVEAVVNRFSSLQGRPAKDVADATTGLGTPRWTITLTDTTARTYRLLVGKNVPLAAAQTYVRADNGETRIVDLDLANLLHAPVADYRDKTVVEIKPDDVVRISVEGAENYTLQKSDAHWSFVQPIPVAADDEKVKSLLKNLDPLRVREFVEDHASSLAPFELQPGKERLVVHVWVKDTSATGAKSPTTSPAMTSATGTATSLPGATMPTTSPAGKEYVIAFGKPVGTNVYARVGDSKEVLIVDGSLRQSLAPKIAELRDKSLLKLPANIARLNIQTPTISAELSKRTGLSQDFNPLYHATDWTMTKPFEGQANDQAVKNLLEAASKLKADTFPESLGPLVVYGLDKPRATVTLLTDDAQPRSFTLMIGAATASGEMTYVSTGSPQSVAVVKTADVQDLLADGAAYWDPALYAMPQRGLITRIVIQRPSGLVAIHRPQGNWVLDQAAPANVDAASVDNIVAALQNLRADKIVALAATVPAKYADPALLAEGVTVSYTVDLPAATTQTASTGPTTATSSPATKPASVQVTVKVVKIGQSAYAWVQGRKVAAVGEFPMSLYENLLVEMRDRTVWRLVAADIDSLRIVAGEAASQGAAGPSQPLELRRQKDGWADASDAYFKVDSKKVQAYLQAACDLKVTRYTDIPDADAAKFGLDKPALVLELVTAKGEKHRLAVGDKPIAKGTDLAAKAGEVKGIFALSAQTMSALNKSRKDFQAMASQAPPDEGHSDQGPMDRGP